MHQRNALKLQSRNIVLLAAGICMIAAHLSSARPSDSETTTPLHIYTAIPPLAFIVEQIGGPHVAVETLLQEGQDPHLFDPEPRQFYRLSQADLYMMSGLPFEHALINKIKSQNTKLLIVDITTKITFLSPGLHHKAHGHSTGHDHEPDASIRDPHFWLGTHQLRQYINTAANVLLEADPQHTAAYRQNTAVLIARLDSVHKNNVTVLTPYRNFIFFSYHPAFNYFASTYGLRQQTIEIQGRQPGPRTVSALIKQARAAGARTIFVQPQYDTKSAETIASAINGNVVPLDPLAKDVIQNLETIALAIAQSFIQEAVQP
jgi:zinc transport system substrate-binding protein